MEVAPGALGPWTQRLVERPAWSPLRLSLTIGAVLLAAFLCVEVALGRVPRILSSEASHARGDFRVALVLIALVAYLPSAFAVAARGARRTVAELEPILRVSGARLAALREEAGRYDASALRRAGWVGVALLLALPLAANLTIETWFPWLLPPEAIAHRMLLAPLGWFAGRFVYALLAESRRLSRIGRELVQVDLLDLTPLAPLVRHGLRQALLAAGILSIMALALVDAEIAPNLFAVLAVGLAGNAALSLAALLLPVRGVRRAISAAKREELGRTNTELRRARQGAADASPLAGLVAWRGLVEAVPEWPFDAPTLGRFVLYLAIPLGSWLGGALVERAVDVLLP
jgi:hypothetical protein